MRVSIIICTWNRRELLRSTLESLCRLVIPPGQEWEVIVVDNASTDGTDRVIASFEGRLPIRRVVEAELGLSRARNTGVAAATGELLLFTDDDVEVDPEWMAAHIVAAGQWPQAGYFGGVIYAVFEPGVPAWVLRHQDALDGMLSTRDLGPEPNVLPAREFPYGPNMAIRRGVLVNTGFRNDVGRKGNAQIRGSETSVFVALERQGICGVWVPGARVGHRIPASRATLRYLWQYYHGSGRGGVRLANAPSWRATLARSMKAAGRVFTDAPHWPRHVAVVAKELGRLRETVFGGNRMKRDSSA